MEANEQPTPEELNLQKKINALGNLAAQVWCLMDFGQTIMFMLHEQPAIVVPGQGKPKPHELIVSKPDPNTSGILNVQMVRQHPK